MRGSGGAPPLKRPRTRDTRLLRLYRLPVSNCCSGVLAVLRHKGIAFEDCEPPGAHFSQQAQQWRPGYGTEEYKKLVPMGCVHSTAAFAWLLRAQTRVHHRGFTIRMRPPCAVLCQNHSSRAAGVSGHAWVHIGRRGSAHAGQTKNQPRIKCCAGIS